jgi:Zn-dependent protease with chaperone function
MARGRRDQLSDRIGRLDRRRRWARRRAPVWFVVSMLVISLVWALGVLVGLAMVARGWSWITGQGFADVALWGWAPEVIAALTLLMLAVVFLVLFQAGTRGVSHKELTSLGELDEPADQSRAVNVSAELAIGLGVSAPTVRLLDDPAPNALSIPHRRWGPTLVVTSGTDALARDELEALIAHELVHRHAPDARWAAAAQWGVARMRSAGYVMLTIGSFLLLTAIWVLSQGGSFLPSFFAGGTALLVLGWVVETLVKPVGRRLRSDADQLADVGTVHLARHPEAFGRLCEKLAADARTVDVSAHHLDHLWFKDAADTTAAAAAELRRRAADAYHAANRVQPS